MFVNFISHRSHLTDGHHHTSLASEPRVSITIVLATAIMQHEKHIEQKRTSCYPIMSSVWMRRLFIITAVVLSVHNIFSNDPTSPFNLPALPYGEDEDLSYGKSCIYQGFWFDWASVITFGKTWKCVDCHQGVCTNLKRRGRCPSFSRTNVDIGPRVSTQYNPWTRQSALTYKYMHIEMPAPYEIPDCHLSLPCFDLSKCVKDGPLTVFAHGVAAEQQVERAMSRLTRQDMKIQLVNESAMACLKVVTKESYKSPQAMHASSHWQHGQNTYAFDSSKFFEGFTDHPFNIKVNFEMAAVSPVAIDASYLRVGYDTRLAFEPRWSRSIDNLHLHRNRRLLLSFKGNIHDWNELNWQHRWIAAEYWHNEMDVVVDTMCGPNHPYELSRKSDYEELLLNSTFVFCPGGSGNGSYRFAEALAADAIPVVTSDYGAPLEPELDWSGCIVRVSEARIVDLPRLLREMALDEIKSRQQECARLFLLFFGKEPHQAEGVWKASQDQQLAAALNVWTIRIKASLTMQQGPT